MTREMIFSGFGSAFVSVIRKAFIDDKKEILLLYNTYYFPYGKLLVILKEFSVISAQ
jgi:hypothetical protein